MIRQNVQLIVIICYLGGFLYNTRGWSTPKHQLKQKGPTHSASVFPNINVCTCQTFCRAAWKQVNLHVSVASDVSLLYPFLTLQAPLTDMSCSVPRCSM